MSYDRRSGLSESLAEEAAKIEASLEKAFDLADAAEDAFKALRVKALKLGVPRAKVPDLSRPSADLEDLIRKVEALKKVLASSAL